MDAIILAGGQGKRLRPLTSDMPKCLVPINGKPMMSHQIEWLKRYGIERIIVACGYKWEKIKQNYGNEIVYSVEEEPLGTGGALKLALKELTSEEFILVNCDDLTNVDIRELQKIGSNAIVLSRFHSPFGIVETEDGLVKKFVQKPLLPHWAWTGVAILNRNLALPDRGSFETELFEKIRLKYYRHDGYWVTINNEKDLEEAEKVMKENL